MARVLDRKRPFGEVFGDDPDGRRFLQHGMYFDVDGKLIGDEKEVPPQEESEAELRSRLEKEIRAKVEKEYREKQAEVAKSGGSEDDDDVVGSFSKTAANPRTTVIGKR